MQTTENKKSKDKVVQSIQNEAFEHVEAAFEKAKTDLLGMNGELKEQGQKIADASIEIVKKYPVHTAVGAAAVGLLAGILIANKNNK